MKIVYGTANAFAKLTPEVRAKLPPDHKIAITNLVYMNAIYGEWTTEECDDVLYIADEILPRTMEIAYCLDDNGLVQKVEIKNAHNSGPST